MKRTEQYTEQLSRLYPELHQANEKEKILTQTVTFQVTDDCNLACTYCYQIKKGKRKMSLVTAEKMIDLLLTGEKGMKEYINPHKSPGLSASRVFRPDRSFPAPASRSRAPEH